MKNYKFSELLEYKDKIENLYNKFGINLNPSSRINQYFSCLKKIEEARSLDKDAFGDFIKKDKVKNYFSLFYTLELCHIYDAIVISKSNETILKEKLRDLAKGNYLLSEESLITKRARDTQFELSLFSFLQAKGLNAELSSPNPDIIFSTGKFTLNVECKRPFHPGTLTSNIREAINQFENNPNKKTIPVVALSLEQVLLGDDVILDTLDEKTTLQFLNAKLSQFHQENLPFVEKMCKGRPFLFLYHIGCLTGLSTELAGSTYILGDIHNFETSTATQIEKELKFLETPF